jgi:hypothetical protein
MARRKRRKFTSGSDEHETMRGAIVHLVGLSTKLSRSLAFTPAAGAIGAAVGHPVHHRGTPHRARAAHPVAYQSAHCAELEATRGKRSPHCKVNDTKKTSPTLASS